MDLLKKIWIYGSKEPAQRIGIIILTIGLFSFTCWFFKSDLYLEDVLDPSYFPKRRDYFFFHLYLYLIPLGLVMSWGYEILLNIKKWVLGNKEVIKKEGKPLLFSNNESAFEFASTLFSKNFNQEILSIGIVRDKLTSNTNKPVFIVELADKQKVIVAGINDRYSNYLGVGHLIYWKFVEPTNYEAMPEVEAIGYIVATLENSFDPKLKKWKVLKDLT